MGIVLSLYRQGCYRWYDDNGNPQKGKFVKIFEEEYSEPSASRNLIPFWKEWSRRQQLQLYNGYFAIDNKKDSPGQKC